MCGIVGIVGYGAPVAAEVLERATQSLAHRGPDDSGTILLRDHASGGRSTEIGLGSRRLAILDLSPLGHQPMRDAETGNWIVYNGEIYNFREVRKELEQAGVVLSGNSDTEVLLKSYARWGNECLDKFRGMFAFAIWDALRHRLFLARDPMGIKPLYYAQVGPHFVFASEVRTLLATDLVHRQLDPAGIVNYLTFGSACDPLTLIEGVHSLPPGCWLTWEEGNLRTEQYWDLINKGSDAGQRLQPPVPESAELAAEQLRPLLEEAVRLQLVSDVPVGVFLSGGIDSSSLVSILSRSGKKPSTFSIVFREAEFSEAEHSRAIAKKFGTEHHEITVSQTDVLASVPDALRAMDLPTMDGINTYFVSREARRAGMKVALSGLGGDEIFAGYTSFRTVPRMERFTRVWKHLPSVVRGSLASAFAELAPESDQNRKLTSLARDNGRVLHPYFLTRMLFTPAQRDSLFLARDSAESEAARAFQSEMLGRSCTLDAINRVSYLESRCYMLNTLLRDADCMSMSQGLEVRVPLIDHRIAGTVLALPGAWKLNRTPKKLLVGALDGSLPDEIVHRPKRGFTLPFEHWMRQDLRPEVESVLNSKRVDSGPLSGLLNGKQVEQVWKDFIEGRMSWSRPWSLYVLERWCEQHA
jgi:asparagine synthase (glutamine-hydrolysing)